MWYVTCPNTYAPSHLALDGVEAGSVADVEAGTVAGVEAGSVAGVEAGSVAGVEAGRVAGVEAGSVASVEAGSVAGIEAESVAAEAEYHKRIKYQPLDSVYLFMPLTSRHQELSAQAAPFFLLANGSQASWRNPEHTPFCFRVWLSKFSRECSNYFWDFVG